MKKGRSTCRNVGGSSGPEEVDVRTIPTGPIPIGPGLCGFPCRHLLKLSEKGLERRLRHEFGRYTEDRRRGKGTSRRSVVLCCRRLRDFSDSFYKECSRKLGYLARPGQCIYERSCGTNLLAIQENYVSAVLARKLQSLVMLCGVAEAL